jgi:hypothetical protein
MHSSCNTVVVTGNEETYIFFCGFGLNYEDEPVNGHQVAVYLCKSNCWRNAPHPLHPYEGESSKTIILFTYLIFISKG